MLRVLEFWVRGAGDVQGSRGRLTNADLNEAVEVLSDEAHSNQGCHFDVAEPSPWVRWRPNRSGQSAEP